MILSFFLCCFPNSFGQKQHDGKVLLAVFAHPDDESTVAPILAKYEREGTEVHTVIITDGRYSTNSYHDHKAGDELFIIVESTKPDAILTWGPDGGSTHMDHRLVGASIIQVYLNKDWEKPTSLFFYGTPVESIQGPKDKILLGQASKHLKTKVSYTKADLGRAFNSLKSNYSQTDPTLTKLTYKERKASREMFV